MKLTVRQFSDIVDDSRISGGLSRSEVIFIRNAVYKELSIVRSKKGVISVAFPRKKGSPGLAYIDFEDGAPVVSKICRVCSFS